MIRNFEDMKVLLKKEVTLGGSRRLILPLQSQEYSFEYARKYKEEQRMRDPDEQLKLKKELEKMAESMRQVINNEQATFVDEFREVLITCAG
jgi:hypothetical protein